MCSYGMPMNNTYKSYKSLIAHSANTLYKNVYKNCQEIGNVSPLSVRGYI